MISKETSPRHIITTDFITLEPAAKHISWLNILNDWLLSSVFFKLPITSVL